VSHLSESAQGRLIAFDDCEECKYLLSLSTAQPAALSTRNVFCGRLILVSADTRWIPFGRFLPTANSWISQITRHTISGSTADRCCGIFGGGQSSRETTAQDNKPVPPENDKAEHREFMRGKLSMAQKIIEGIATEDFDMIKQGGLELVSIAESAAWKSTRDPIYQYYSANFEQAAKSLIDAAKSKSVEKATFAYVHVNFSCTTCHQHVQRNRVSG